MQLHIINGDSVGDMLKQSSIVQGEVLCWRDVLHDGPIVAAEGQAYLKARASFIHETISLPSPLPAMEISEQQILDDFVQRQAVLDKLSQYKEIVLWFEHDLYDQLQLAECLFHLAKHPELTEQFRIICIGEHPELDYFHGLGNLSISQLEALYPNRQTLSVEQLELGKRVWQALVANTPEQLNHLLLEPLSPLPFMANALLRFAQEYPWLDKGLSLTQLHILESLAKPMQELPILQSNLRQQAQYQGEEEFVADQRYQQIMEDSEIKLGRLFVNLQTLEDAPFLGDAWLNKELYCLSHLTPPCVKIDNKDDKHWSMDASYTITDTGLKALEGAMLKELSSQLSFWRGGVNISQDNYWCWDHKQGQIVMQ
ncbi:DUF1835 domain-containing protein [Agarivorans sp. B2Z047]|uniref:DUF1835 domain-containing protein n=1 Tax=Agarivorans sp. B2Z047 TaxID=2652721 RepID=UPI00128AFE48|nr:DUF1835 domain-containing protein [Agarivorans sp. B2Z047]MPW28437.1 DUF1835 domain-containing protein [Agarivorans sp. B2Z047]UQN41002.1 DUF1835 domain-containing protein [Agarivorans sp. B2Z047]